MCKKPALGPIALSKALGMVASGITHTQAAKALNVDRRVVDREVKRFREEKEGIVEIEPGDLAAKISDIEQVKKHHAAQCHTVMNRIVENITDEKLQAATLQQAAVSYGIFGEKLALMASINETVDHRHVLVGKVEVADSTD